MHCSHGMSNKTCLFRCLLLLPFVALLTIRTIEADDGWRRTADGWEKLNLKPEIVAKTDPVHPGQLGILQVAGSCLVLGLFASRATIVRTAG